MLWCGFGLLWVYVILRALFTEPLHDETATFFHYIETGDIFGPDIVLDANNHIVNSLAGRWMYELFGDWFFLYRLPALLAFPLYFIGIYRISRSLKLPFAEITTICIASIPYTLEYFAYSRGYGFSLGTLIFSLSLLINYQEKRKMQYAFFAVVFAVLSCWSVISFFLPAGLIAGSLLLTHVFGLKLFSWKKHLAAFIFLAGFGLGILPLLAISEELRLNGRLYYGSMDGLWQVTGKTLSRYVFFCDTDWLKWLFILFIVGVGIAALLKIRSLGIRSWFLRPQSQLLIFCGTLLLAFVAMAKILSINYPEDRVAMYLIPYFLLLFFSVFRQLRMVQWTAVLFPLILAFHLSLHTSVFTADERLTHTFFNKVYSELEPGATLAGYPTAQLNWQYFQRSKPEKYFFHYEARFSPVSDVMVMKDTFVPQITPGYAIIARDAGSGYVALKRMQKFAAKPVWDTNIVVSASDGEFVNLAERSIPKSWKGRRLKIEVSGELESAYTSLKTLVIATEKSGQPFRYEDFDLRRSFGINVSETVFRMSYEITSLEPSEDKLKIYVWNLRKVKMSAGSVHVSVVELINRESKAK